MKTNLSNFFEVIDLIFSKVEIIETLLSGKPEESKFKDYMNVEQLLRYLEEERALSVSKSKIYKLTATAGGIPFRKSFGQLIFLKKEIDLWLTAQLNPQRNQVLGKGKAQ